MGGEESERDFARREVGKAELKTMMLAILANSVA